MFKQNSDASITKALKTCKEVANGNLEARITNITEKGEAGELMHTINRLIERMDANIRKPGIYLVESEAARGDTPEFKGCCKRAGKDMPDIFSKTGNAAGGALLASADSATQGEEIRDHIDALHNLINSFLTDIRQVM